MIAKNPVFRPLYNPSKELLERLREVEKNAEIQEIQYQQAIHYRETKYQKELYNMVEK